MKSAYSARLCPSRDIDFVFKRGNWFTGLFVSTIFKKRVDELISKISHQISQYIKQQTNQSTNQSLHQSSKKYISQSTNEFIHL